MSKDSVTLGQLYEDIRKGNFDWENLFSNDMGSDSVLLWESVEKISDGMLVNGGTQDKYEVTLTNGQIFHVFIDFLTPKKTNDTIINNSQANLKSGTPNEAYELYEKHLTNLNPEDRMCYVSFKDSKGRQNTTGEVGLSAKGLFSGLKAALMDSLWGTSQNHKHLVAICIKVDGGDPSRISLFHKLMSRFLNETYPTIIMDYQSDKPYISIIAVK